MTREKNFQEVYELSKRMEFQQNAIFQWISESEIPEIYCAY